MEPLLIAGTAVAGLGLGAAVFLLARRPKAAEEPVEMEVLDFDPTPGPAFTPRPVAPIPAPIPPPAPPRATPTRPPLPPAPSMINAPRGHPERAPAMVLTHGVEMRDETYQRMPARAARDASAAASAPRFAAAAPAPRPPMREPPGMKTWAQKTMEELPSPIPSEWARRQVGPAEPGRTKGACGGCGAALSVSNQRPVRIACPVCGRTKLLAA